ncbi:cytochrome c [Sphingomonas sp. LB-2]|uniref:c-type cytochrome n=1 Tax=Sphingomonas caeni TaxID=2984949 RepID=UPI00223126D2|nr:cytochrome c [Sphingomonas caeni]MCW3847937.1 cytochrome c [Sphingomonas caeni]
MRVGTIALAASGLLLASVAASANGAHPAADPAGIVKGRQAGMRMSGAIMGGIKGAIDRGDDVKTQAFAARSIAGWAAAVPGMFPEGSDVPPSGALPAVWSDAPGFAAKAAAYQAAATKMADAAKAGDKDGFAAAWAETRTTCQGCHDSYKKP